MRVVIELIESILLLITLTFQRSSKVNSSDNTIEYSTSKIVHITISTMKKGIFLYLGDGRGTVFK